MSSIAPDEGVTVGRRDHILAAATLAQKKLRARDLVGERCFYKFHATSVLWFAGTIGSCRVQGTKVEVRIRTAIYDKQTPYKTLHPLVLLAVQENAELHQLATDREVAWHNRYNATAGSEAVKVAAANARILALEQTD